ncbi:phenol-soluble modulin export ABC transporter ATP-binding protein PmtA [Staphylococcus massiliensis]|uniref:ABC transporter ATP-binding protein n=1 Tax=Staphylococcus massiliensis S46 TaxID=1229783 RepID=K9AE41_9STAP|nr:ABC transporter ATP-binding protein [Staphylococcus massiliensis]EKU45599.1 ABC transporter ATP-binding protein [Staphylococcus massiliensis S46]MCG3399903.1 ABC transporter ATP-binding protein [Staphylococcus massiliensis]MCG3402622.1 ABC transporter ATP-binding protein [Staphylococcus massiliensis]MCG3413090.1 ABC transporter ATP-binding protein [Staphylococcus massiliensis]PNZ97932.1 ABC transporter ATP-binding protein [Staphylococcus massiliensis CCUG 55927]
MNVVEFKDVSYQRKAFELENLNFSIPKGYVTGFIGANGSGKTTTIRLLMDLLRPKSGTIHLFGKGMKADPVEIKNKIGFVYSELYLNDNWHVKKVSRMLSKFYRNWNENTFEHYLNYFKLPHNEKIKNFSTGMKMKLSITIAFSHEAELFVLDEPTAGLDPVVRSEVLSIIQEELINEDKTVFFSTHIISDLERIADYIVYLKQGQIQFETSKDDLLNTYKIVRGDDKDLDAELDQLLIHKTVNHTGYEALTKDSAVFKELFGPKVVIDDASIEDIMVHFEKDKDTSIEGERYESTLS